MDTWLRVYRMGGTLPVVRLWSSTYVRTPWLAACRYFVTCAWCLLTWCPNSHFSLYFSTPYSACFIWMLYTFAIEVHTRTSMTWLVSDDDQRWIRSVPVTSATKLTGDLRPIAMILASSLLGSQHFASKYEEPYLIIASTVFGGLHSIWKLQLMNSVYEVCAGRPIVVSFWYSTLTVILSGSSSSQEPDGR